MLRSWYGVSARCGEGDIAIATLKAERVLLCCRKPTTREACDTLLGKIAEAD